MVRAAACITGTKLEPGSAWDGLPLLAQRLVAVGDLPPDAPVSPVYDDTLRRGVSAFQQRHGLTADGVLGQATLAQLAVTPADACGRSSWPWSACAGRRCCEAPRMIVVNVPEFVLRAYEVRDGQVAVELTMKVIVGKALDTQTPLFDEEMRYIEFSPYWNVPPSIARKEIVPRLRRDPAYFEQQGFEFVTVQRPGGSPRCRAEHLDAVLRGRCASASGPGRRTRWATSSSSFPTTTTSTCTTRLRPQLFQRDRRDFSHGCIRVEEPVALARFVLQNAPEWTEERIRAGHGAAASRPPCAWTNPCRW